MFSSKPVIRCLAPAVVATIVLLGSSSRVEAQVNLYGEAYGNSLPQVSAPSGYSPRFTGVTPFSVFGPYNGERFGGYRIDGWNGYGIDNTSWGSSYGANWGIGYVNPFAAAYAESPYTLNMMSPALFQSRINRYNLMSADAATAYQAANLYQQQAIDGQNRYPRPKVIEVKPRPAAAGNPSGGAAEGTPVLIPHDKLIASDGHVRWPAAAPTGNEVVAARQAADLAVQAAVQEFLKLGKASIHAVIEARNKLALFAIPALEKLRVDSPADAIGFEFFLQSLDSALNSMSRSNPQ